MVFASHSAVKFAVPVSTDHVGCVQSAGDVVMFSANDEMENIEIKIAKQIVPICLKLSNKLHVCVQVFAAFSRFDHFLHIIFGIFSPFFTHALYQFSNFK